MPRFQLHDLAFVPKTSNPEWSGLGVVYSADSGCVCLAMVSGKFAGDKGGFFPGELLKVRVQAVHVKGVR